MNRNASDSRHTTADGRQAAAGIRHSSLFTRHFLFCIVVSALAATAARAETTDSYVRDGLLACWDGIENAGAKQHDPAAANWIDVVGGKSFALNNVTVADDRIVFKGINTSYGVLDEAGTTATFGAATNGTLEIVYACATGIGVILQSSSESGIAYGFSNASTLIPCNLTSPTAIFTPGTATNTAAVRYSKAKAASVVANGTELEKGSGNCWYGANKTTVVGNRTTHSGYHFNGAIYCIRLYDRQLSDAEIAANLAVDRHRFQEGRTAEYVASVAQTNGVWYATASVLEGSGELSLHVVSPQGATNVVSLSNGVAAAPATFTTAFTGVAADTIYSVFASFASGTSTNFTRVASIFNGPVSVVATADATPTTAGVFTVSRPAADGATNMPLTVSFTLSGTAFAGTHYARIPSYVTIPAGAASATVQIATVKSVAATTSLTLALDGKTHLLGNPSSATMSVTTVRAPAALVWAAGTSATELTDVANWTPYVPAFMEDDTLSFTGDGESAYRFTATNDMAVKSFTVANGTSSVVIDLCGHTFSNETASSGSFKQTGTGSLALLNGQIDARTFSFQTATLAATNFVLNGNKAFNTTTITFSRDRARYLLDNVKIDLCTTYYGKLTFMGWDYEIDARNVVYPDASRVPDLTFSGTNATVRFNGSGTYLLGSMKLNGKNNRVSVADGRFYRAGGSSYGGLTISGEGHELLVTNSEAGACVSYIPDTAAARRCVVRIAKGGNYQFTRIDDGLDKTHSFEGTSNLFEVVGGTLSLPTLRLGYVEGAGGNGGNILAVRGDDSVVTSANGFYVGNANKLPVRLVFQPGETGFDNAAPVRLTGSGKNVRIATNTVFEVDARTLTRTRDHGRFTLPLMSFRSTTQAEAAFNAEALATFNETLVSQPKGGTLSLETDGNYRVLTWNYYKHGTMLLLR